MARYQQALLGVLWVILQPLVLVVIISVFMGLVLSRGDRYGLPFPVFLFTAWVVWRTFSKVVGEAGKSIQANGALVQRIYLPKLFFPLSVAAASIVDLIAMTGALLVLLVVYGVAPGSGLVTLPILVLIMYATALGVSFMFAASSVEYRDFEILTPLIIQAWFWMSPIIYTSTAIPERYRALYYLNPIAVVVEGFRWAFTQSPMPPPEAWLLGGASSVVLLVSGYLYFRRREPLFADLL